MNQDTDRLHSLDDDTSQAAEPAEPLIDRQRYRRVRNFFLRVFAHLIFWDILMNRPLLGWLRPQPTRRWRRLSRDFRELAVIMGGVLVKLGQFLSVRVDILPPEVTEELVGLRDEMPAEELTEIVAQIEAEFDCPLDELFASFSPDPVGAASLGQVHAATLADGHTKVVVKVLRPEISTLVETDLAAIRYALGWLKRYRAISRRVDLDWLFREFSDVTRGELDLVQEGRNAERFAAAFAADQTVRVPAIHWTLSSRRVLAMEDVGFFKITDHQGMADGGIARSHVARTLYRLYLTQIFTTNFVHADPHPGNIFVKPLPTPEESAQGLVDFVPGEPVAYRADRPFQIVLVDFGMVTTIPERLRAALREYVIGVGTRDAHRIVQSYVQAGTLLPEADLGRLEAAHRALLKRFWGANAREIKNIVLEDSGSFMREYRDLIYAAPFQIQADMLFTVRAVAILSGIATRLDESFDPWQEIIPFAKRLADSELRGNWQEWFREFVALAERLARLPVEVEETLQQIQSGSVQVHTVLPAEQRDLMSAMQKSINRLAWFVAAAGMMAAGLFAIGGDSPEQIGIMLLCGSALLFLWGIWSGRR